MLETGKEGRCSLTTVRYALNKHIEKSLSSWTPCKLSKKTFFYHFHMFPVSHKSFTSKYNLKNAPQDSFYVPKIVRHFLIMISPQLCAKWLPFLFLIIYASLQSFLHVSWLFMKIFFSKLKTSEPGAHSGVQHW